MKNRNRKHFRASGLLALILSICMALGNVPLEVYADEPALGGSGVSSDTNDTSSSIMGGTGVDTTEPDINNNSGSTDENNSSGSTDENGSSGSTDENGSSGSTSETSGSTNGNGSIGSTSETNGSTDENGSIGSTSETDGSTDENGGSGSTSETDGNTDTSGTDGNKDTTENNNTSETDGNTDTTDPTTHEHTWGWNFASSGNTENTNSVTITAHCTNTDEACEYSSAGPSFTLSAENATYDGEEHGATFKDNGTASLIGALANEIHYVGRDGTEYDDSTTAPTKSGKYTASITFDEGKNKASVDFEIYYSELEHVHTWAYTASGDTITAYCTNTKGECQYQSEENAISLTLYVPDAYEVDGEKRVVYNGKGHAAKCEIKCRHNITTCDECKEDIESFLGGTTAEKIDDTIVYKFQSIWGLKDITGLPSSASTNKYTANITLGGVTATVEFKIVEIPKAVLTGDLGENGWYKSDVIVSAPEGYEIWFDGYSDSWGKTELKLTENAAFGTQYAYYRLRSEGDTEGTTTQYIEVKIDNTSPTGTVSLSGSSDENTISSTLGSWTKLYENDTDYQTLLLSKPDEGINVNYIVDVTANDVSGAISSNGISYCVTDTKKTQKELLNSDLTWKTLYTSESLDEKGTFNTSLRLEVSGEKLYVFGGTSETEDTSSTSEQGMDQAIIYVKITDQVGNVTYISSDVIKVKQDDKGTDNTDTPSGTLSGSAGGNTGGDNSSSGGNNNSGGDNSSSGGDSNLSGGSNSIGGGSNSSGGDGIVNDQNDKKNDGTTSDSESGSSSGMNFINIPGNDDTTVTPEPTTHEGTITTSAIIQDGSPITGVEIATSTEKLKSKSGIFTLIEQKEIEAGKNARVWAVVSATDLSNLTKKEIAEITDETEAIMGEGATPLYFDLTLWVQVDGEAARQVYETGDEIAINIEIPASIVSNAKRVIRTYNVIRLHNGDVSVLSGKLVDTVSKIRFRTDRFSTYAIAYTDLTDTTELSIGDVDGTDGADPSTTGTDNTKQDDSNKSEDDSNKPGDSNQPNDSNGSNKNSNNGSNNGKNNGTNEQKNAGNSNQQNNTNDPGNANSQTSVGSNSGTGNTTTPVITQSDGKQVTAASGSKTVTSRQKDNEPKTGDAGRTESSAATAIVLAGLLCLTEILQRKRKIN